MEIRDNYLDECVKFSEIKVGQDFQYVKGYYIKTNTCYSSTHTREFNCVSIQSGIHHHFNDDELVIPAHGIYSIKKK